MGIGSWIGGVVNGVVKPVVGAVSKYKTEKNEILKAELQGELEITKANAELKVTQIKNQAAMDMTQLEGKIERDKGIDVGNLSLDKMSMGQAAKSCFDECITVLLLSPFIYLLYYNFIQLPPPEQVFTAMNSMPQIYWAVIILIMMRYLSLRGTVERFAKMYFESKSKKDKVKLLETKPDAIKLNKEV